MELIFLRHGGHGSNRALAEIRKLIATTKGMLRVAVAYFNHVEIADLLVARKAAGLSTRILINASDIVRPVEGFVEYQISAAAMKVIQESHMHRDFQVRTLGLPRPGYHNMHHKFAVGDDTVLFGSVNWTRPALSENYEFMVVENSRAIVDRFTGEFDAIWEEAHPLDGNTEGLRVIVCPICKTSGTVDFESYGAHCVSCGNEFRPAEPRR